MRSNGLLWLLACTPLVLARCSCDDPYGIGNLPGTIVGNVCDVRTRNRTLRSRAQVLAGPQKASPVRAVTAVACPGEIAYAVGESQNSCARANAGEIATASVRAMRIGVFMPLLRAPIRIG